MLRVRISPAVANTVEAITPHIKEILRGEKKRFVIIVTMIIFAVY